VKKAPTLAASSFAVVADLRPLRPTIIISTPVYVDPIRPGEDLSAHDHRIAVLFDEDEDERVIDVLTAILYRSPLAFARIAAVHEHKGLMIVWGCGYTAEDKAVISAAADATVLRGDNWPVEVRQLFIDADAGSICSLDIDIVQLHELFGLGKTPPDPQLERDIAEVLNQLGGQHHNSNNKTLSLKRRGQREQ